MSGAQPSRGVENKRRKPNRKASAGSRSAGPPAANGTWRWQTGPDLKLNKVSASFKSDTGLDRRRVLGKSHEELAASANGISETLARKIGQHKIKMRRRRGFRDFILPVNGGGGDIHYLKLSGKPVYGPRGKFLGYEGSGTDVTERLETRTREIAENLPLSEIVDTIGGGFALWDDEDRLVLCNDVFRRRIVPSIKDIKAGLPFDTLAKAMSSELVGLDIADIDDWVKRRKKALRQKQSRAEFLLKDGTWILITTRRAGSGYTVSNITDISDIKERELESRRDAQGNAQMAIAISSMNAGVFITNPNMPENPIVYVNPAFRLPSGNDASTCRGKGFSTLFQRKSDREAAAVLQHAMERRKSANVVVSSRDRDGATRWHDWAVSPIKGANGRINYYLGIQTDVTARKQEEDGLARRVRQQSVVARLGRRALSEENFDDFLAGAAALVAETIDVDIVSIRELLPSGDELLLRAGHGWKRGMVGKRVSKIIKGTPSAHILKTGEAVVINELGTDKRFEFTSFLGEMGVVSSIGLKISGPNGPFGILAVHSRKPRKFLSDEVNFLESVAYILDVAVEHARDAAALRDSEVRFDLAVKGSNDGLWDWDLETGEIYFSPRWRAMLGLGDANVIEDFAGWRDRVHADDREVMESNLETHLKGKTSYFSVECRLLHHDGSYRWMLIRGLAVRAKGGKATRIAGSMSDITATKQAEHRLLRDALHDTLTSLPNRALFTDRVTQAIVREQRRRGYLYAVLFLDFDRFKVINDSLGHSYGDQMLIEISRRLTDCVREVDTVARLGGDEFAILLEDLDSESMAETVARRINSALALPFNLAGRDIVSSASIGITFSSLGYDRPGDLIRDADIAMYQAKTDGRARHVVFNKGMHLRAVSQLEMETDLRHAYDHEEFHLNYQPVVSIKTGGIAGFEALIRWNHPSRGNIPPGDFIPIAEETGVIIPIGKWVLAQACKQMRKWVNAYPKSRLTMAVNISPKQFADPKFIDDVKSVLRKTGLSGKRLSIEITEGAIMENPHEVTKRLATLRGLGIELHVDDFGTGYSSLSHLHRFPIDALKIDRSFVITMGESEENMEIVRTIISLAHILKLSTVAEGVETKKDLDQLKKLKCDMAQGYYFSRPLDARAATAYLAKARKKK